MRHNQQFAFVRGSIHKKQKDFTKLSFATFIFSFQKYLVLFFTMASASIELSLSLSRSFHTSNKWRLALVKIICSRTIFALVKNGIRNPKRTSPKASRSPSYSVISIDPDDNTFTVDQNRLTHLVRDENLESLSVFGGVESVASALNTDISNGIDGDEEDRARRQRTFGSNTYKRPPTKSFLYFVVEAFKDPTILILLVCAALSLGFGIKGNGVSKGWYDGGSIFTAVFLVIVVSAGINFRQSRQFDKLSRVSNNIQIDVVRKGRREQISIFDIVVGDIVCLKIGDQIPADGLFVDGHSLQVDKSSMTGESDHVQVSSSCNPFMFSGTKVADGYARMLVTSVGMNTTWGEMMSSISRDLGEQTPLQAQLYKLTSAMGKVGLVVAFLVLVVLLVRYFSGNTPVGNGNAKFVGGQTTPDDIVNAVVRIIGAAITIVVVTIPEGLPLAVTLTLAYSMKRMMADRALVRRLSACETMGSATTICTDKTGTLTLNQMQVTKYWQGRDDVKEGAYSSISKSVLDLIKQGVALNTAGAVYKSSSGSELEFSGSPTEKAILSWAVQHLNMDMEEEKQGCTVIQVEAFNSKKKRSGVMIRSKKDDTVHLYWKGAAEMILAMCTSYYDASGIVKNFGEGEKMIFEHIIRGMAAKSLRCIGFAHTLLNEDDEQLKPKEDRLTLLALVGIKDPCRPGVKKAVKACQDAGLTIKMITGDNIFIAKAIAIECGILKNDEDEFSGAIVEGVEFRNYTPEERLAKVEKIRVMARSSPLDKLLMVECLKKKGHVVAVTGDGTDDAPALKEADIGLSMGINGAEVAKESSDIVILDDSFTSVVMVLRWGRCVYNNIQKLIQVKLTVHAAALVIHFVAAVFACDVPLTAFELLCVYAFMDILGAFAPVIENPTEDLVNKPPVGRNEPIISNIMWRNIIAQALYQITIPLILQYKGQSIFGVDKAVNHALVFNTFVMCQTFNEFELQMNKLCMRIVLQEVMVEFLKKFGHIESLTWVQWGACIGIAAASWLISWIVKYIPVPEEPIFGYLKSKMKKLMHRC